MAYQDDRQLHSILLVLCILVSATSFSTIPECGEGKIAKKTEEGYKCVCYREQNYYTISDGRTCGFRSGGCPLGKELQDGGECQACRPGTFKSFNGAGLCKKQIDCEILGLETVSYGDSLEDAKCGRTRKTLIKEWHTTMANKQISYVTLVPTTLPAERSPVMTECGEGKLVTKTNKGYKCVCNREENYFTMSDGRTCGFRSGGCPLGEELQDGGECQACRPGTFKSFNGAGLCKKQTKFRNLGLETVSYGDSSDDAKCGSTLNTTLLKDISRATEQSTIEPPVSATCGNTTHNDEGSSVVIIIAPVVGGLAVIAFVACVWKKRHMWKRKWRNMCREMWRKNSCNAALSDDEHDEGNLTQVMIADPKTPPDSSRTGLHATEEEQQTLTGACVGEASAQYLDEVDARSLHLNEEETRLNSLFQPNGDDSVAQNTGVNAAHSLHLSEEETQPKYMDDTSEDATIARNASANVGRKSQSREMPPGPPTFGLLSNKGLDYVASKLDIAWERIVVHLSVGLEVVGQAKLSHPYNPVSQIFTTLIYWRDHSGITDADKVEQLLTSLDTCDKVELSEELCNKYDIERQ